MVPDPINIIDDASFTVVWGDIDQLVSTHKITVSREKQLLAADILASKLFGPSASIQRLPSGKPLAITESGSAPVSISHGGGIIALAHSKTTGAVGIDVEGSREQLLRVYPRFLRPEEYPSEITVATLLPLWTMKEAAWKAMEPQPPSLLDVPLHRFRFRHYSLRPDTLLTVAFPVD